MKRFIILFTLLSLFSTLPAFAQADSGWVNNEEGCWCGYQTGLVRDYWIVGNYSNQTDRDVSGDTMEEFNKYATLFNIRVANSNGLGSLNGINEINTFIRSTESSGIYGFTMGSGLYGRAVMVPNANFGFWNECKDFSTADCGPFTETDVVINDGFGSGWTNDWYADDGSPALIHTTVLHEGGHTLGFHHIHSLPAFGDSFSTMNYMNDDSGRYITRMDAKTIRAEYGSRSNNLTDMGIFNFTYGNGQYAETYASTSTTSLQREEAFAVNNWLIQNIGTANAGNVEVTFYLWPSSLGRHYPQPGDHNIGTIAFGTVNSDAEGDQSGTPVMAPYTVSDGSYWIGAIVTVNGSEDSSYAVGMPNQNRFILGHGARTTINVSGGPTGPTPAMNYDSHSHSEFDGNGNGFIDQGETITLPVTIGNNGSGGATGISAVLSTSTTGITITDNSATYSNIGVGNTGTSASPHFQFSVDPTVPCGTLIQFTLDITTNEGTWQDTFSQAVGEEIVYYADTFSGDTGWVSSGAATTGQFERAVPEATTAQPGNDSPNDGDSRCMVTGPLAGAAVGTYDVDGGTATVTSPVIDITGAGGAVLVYDRAYFSGANGDPFLIEISQNGGGSYTTVENLSNFSGSTYSDWTTHSVSLGSLGITAMDQLRIRVNMTDGGQGTIAEGLFDNVKIVGYQCVPYSGSCTDPATPAAPTVTNNCGDLDVSWAAAAGADTYNVYRRTGGCGNNGWAVITTGVVGTTWTDTTAVDTSTYGYYIEAVNACNTLGDKNNCGSATAASCVSCNAVTGLTNNGAADVDTCADSGVQVTWSQDASTWGDSGSGTRTYAVLRDGTPIQTGITYGTTSYTDTTGTNGQAYTYTVRYNNGCGNTAVTGGASAQDDISATPAAPLNLLATGACGQNDITWDVSSGATDYAIYRKTNACNGGGWALLSATTGGVNSYSDTSATSGQQYSYRVTASNSCGQTSGNSNCDSATSFGVAPSTVANNGAVDADTCSDTGVDVSWAQDPGDWGDGGSGTRTYDVLRDGAPIQSGMTYGTTTYTDTTGTNGQAYTYTVRYNNGCALNAVTTGTSASDAVGTSPSSLTNNGAADVSACADSGVQITWNQDAGSWGDGGTGTYNVLRNGTPIQSGITYGTTSYTDTTGTNGTTYTYSVEYVNGCGNATETAGVSASDVVPAIPTITGGSSNTCPTAVVGLSTEGGMSNYQWFVDGSPVGGATSSGHNADTTGSYTVSYTNGNGCSVTSAGHAVTITACVPNIIVDSFGALSEVFGDGDSNVDPGEKWSLPVVLTNNGQADASGVTADLSATGITICNGTGTYGAIAMGGTSSFTFEFTVDTAFSCGTNIDFNVVSKTSTEITPAGADENAALSQIVGKPGVPTDVTLDYSFTVPATITKDATTDFALNVGDSQTVTSVSVDVSLTAPVGGNNPTITVSLISPAATSATLYSGSTAGWTDTTFTEAAVFDGEDSAGNWTLRILHSRGGGPGSGVTDGTLDLYDLHITHVENGGYTCPYTGAGVCTPAASIYPVPDGDLVTGTAMAGSKAVADGSTITVTWDTPCANSDYHMVWGNGADISTMGNQGGVCTLGTSGSTSWGSTPTVTSGQWVWWVITGNNGAGTEGSLGYDSTGAERTSASSGTCGMGTLNVSGTCP